MARRAVPELLRIEDPRALRAVAHEARQRVIRELYAGEVLTATDAARLCGLTPSAMSYHLRALEKWGIVARDEPSGDGRERPWRAAARSFEVPRAVHARVPDQARHDLVEAFLADVEAGLDRAATGGGIEDTTLSQQRLWLTTQEHEQLERDVQGLLEAYAGRTRRRHPRGSRPRDSYWLLLPAAAADGREAGAGAP